MSIELGEISLDINGIERLQKPKRSQVVNFTMLSNFPTPIRVWCTNDKVFLNYIQQAANVLG